MHISNDRTKDTTRPCWHSAGHQPNVGLATAHLNGLRKHLLAMGHPLEAAAVAHTLDMLIPSRVCERLP